jgi:hypothetical protein
VNVGVPRDHQGNTQRSSDPGTHDPQIPRASNVQDIWTKRLDALFNSFEIPLKQWIKFQIGVN